MLSCDVMSHSGRSSSAKAEAAWWFSSGEPVGVHYQGHRVACRPCACGQGKHSTVCVCVCVCVCVVCVLVLVLVLARPQGSSVHAVSYLGDMRARGQDTERPHSSSRERVQASGQCVSPRYETTQPYCNLRSL